MNPRLILAALFLGLPLLEIYLFIIVGGAIGAWPTVALVVLAAIAGVVLMRAQGLATLRRAQASLDRRELPKFELLEGVAVLAGGALLIVPGFLTDALGLLCLWPLSRRALVRNVMPRIQIVTRSNIRRSGPAGGEQGGRILEGEYTRKPDE